MLWLLCLLDSQLSDADQKSRFAGKALSDNVPVWEIMIPVIIMLIVAVFLADYIWLNQH